MSDERPPRAKCANRSVALSVFSIFIQLFSSADIASDGSA